MKNINYKKPLEMVIYSRTSKQIEHREKIRELEKVFKKIGAKQDRSEKSSGVNTYSTSLCGIVISYDPANAKTLSPKDKYKIEIHLSGRYYLGNYSGKRGSCLKIGKNLLKILEK